MEYWDSSLSPRLLNHTRSPQQEPLFQVWNQTKHTIKCIRRIKPQRWFSLVNQEPTSIPTPRALTTPRL